MRLLPYLVVTSLAFVVAACSDDDDSSPGVGGDTSSAGESSGDGGRGGTRPGGGSSGRGGSGSMAVQFSDLPGKIRFINHVSDGMTGQALDLYWGSSIGRGELVGTIDYGEITEFMTPRHAEEGLLDADEARYFMVPEGDVTGTPSSFLVQEDPKFAEGTVLTIALSSAENNLTDDLVVSRRTIEESALSTPPAGMAHVYEWSSAFAQIPDGNFVLVGANDLCDPERGEPGGANLGTAFIVPEGATGLALFDANTEPPCATGTEPVTGAIEAGHSYVLLGEAETFEIEARKAILLEVGSEN